MYRVVDLGTKKAGALDEFRRNGFIRIPDGAEAIPASGCLGVDFDGNFADFVQRKGYDFKKANLAEDSHLNELPPAEFYLAWDFLEHLPDVERSKACLARMLTIAEKAVWLRLPSFEDDDCERLKQDELRFTWTHWKGHTSPFRIRDVHDVTEALRALGIQYAVDVYKNLKIPTSHHRSIVPIGSPIDTIFYSESLGKRKRVAYDPPLIGQYEVVCRRLQ